MVFVPKSGVSCLDEGGHLCEDGGSPGVQHSRFAEDGRIFPGGAVGLEPFPALSEDFGDAFSALGPMFADTPWMKGMSASQIVLFLTVIGNGLPIRWVEMKKGGL
jgi:hypothetical protein